MTPKGGRKASGVHRTTILPRRGRHRAVRAFLAPASSGRCATAPRCFRCSSWGGFSTTDCAVETLRSTGFMRCVVRLDSGPGRRLRHDQAFTRASGTNPFDPGGSASELEMLRVFEKPASSCRCSSSRSGSTAGRTCSISLGRSNRSSPSTTAWPCIPGASAVASDSSRLTALVGAGWRPLVFTESTPDGEIVRSVTNLLTNAQSDWASSDA